MGCMIHDKPILKARDGVHMWQACIKARDGCLIHDKPLLKARDGCMIHDKPVLKARDGVHDMWQACIKGYRYESNNMLTEFLCV